MPHAYVDAGREEKYFPHYVRSRRAEAEEVTLLKKASTLLVSPRIPNNVHLLNNIIPKISNLTFEDVNTHLQLGLEIRNPMATKTRPTQAQFLVPM